MSGSTAKKVLLVGLAIVVVVVAGAAVVVSTLDLRSIAEQRLARSLERRVTIGSLNVRWGIPIGVDVKGVSIANAEWGTQPDMLRIDSAVGEIAPWPLLHGVLEFPTLRISGAAIVLERGPHRERSWRPASKQNAQPPTDEQPSSGRARFPTLLDFALQNGSLAYRTSHGKTLQLQMNSLAINSPGVDQPVQVALDGAYNGTAAKLSGTTDSFAVMRTTTAPFKTTFKIETADATADFDGTMLDPLNFDEATGTLRIDAKTLGDVLKIFGLQMPAKPAFQGAGDLSRKGDAWQWADMKGKLGPNQFSGRLALTEATPPNPDGLTLALAFPTLDAKTLVSGSTGNLRTTSLEVDAQPDMTIDAAVTAAQLRDGGMVLSDFSAHGSVMPGKVTISELAFGIAGGKAHGSGVAEKERSATRLTVNAMLSGVDVVQASRLMGSATGALSGRLDARLEAEMNGGTLGAALKDSRGQAVVSVTQGHVARDLLEKLSTDLRTLFRPGQGSEALTCLLVVMEMRNGIGVVAPVRLRAPEAAVIGGGRINLLSNQIDVRVEPEPGSTGFFALGIPLQISGDINSPSVRPAVGSAAEVRSLDRLPAMSAELRQVSDRSACAR